MCAYFVMKRPEGQTAEVKEQREQQGTQNKEWTKSRCPTSGKTDTHTPKPLLRHTHSVPESLSVAAGLLVVLTCLIHTHTHTRYCSISVLIVVFPSLPSHLFHLVRHSVPVSLSILQGILLFFFF